MKTTNLNKKSQIATIRLFHAVLKNNKPKAVSFTDMLKYGILLVDKQGSVDGIDAETAKALIDTLGLKVINWAQSFHKSWDKVATAPIEQLLSEQVLNYFSTYGMESMGFKALNYIPVEKVLTDIDEKPSIESFVVIRVLSEQEIHDEFINYLKTTKSPNRDVIEDIRTLLPLANDITLEEIKSFEIKIMYCDLKKIVPLDAQNFLRYAIYKATEGKITTLVKNKETISSLKSFSYTYTAVQMFKVADIVELSKSFYRFKPLFLAFKSNRDLASTINQIRRLATKNHTPVTGLTASNIINLLAQEKYEAASTVLNKADNREIIKLYNFAKFEMEVVTPARLYNIRNGKVFVRSDKTLPSDIRAENLEWLMNACAERLKARFSGIYKGKTFYIPDEIDYSAPISEKQMLDILPYGTRIKLPKDANALCIAGHWLNDTKIGQSEDGRIDLDFHLNTFNGAIGWNSNYRTDKRDVIFSGDMTSAPAPYGAVEAFRISSSADVPYELSVNAYNVSGDIPFELLFTKDITDKCDFRKDSPSMISAVTNPANVIAPVLKLHIYGNEATIGYYYLGNFTVYGGDIAGENRIPKRELITDALIVTMNKCDYRMSLAEVIELAGGSVVNKKPEDSVEYIDLSPSNLTSSTLFNIVDGMA